MTKRTPRQATKHDLAVNKTAQYYKKQGYNVKADIPGYDKPKSIQGRRPDVAAVKNGNKVIVEVETRDSLVKDTPQREVFKDYADKSSNARFWTKTV